MRWEYYSVDASRYQPDLIDKKMLELGQAGWELVSVVSDDISRTFYFKRSIP